MRLPCLRGISIFAGSTAHTVKRQHKRRELQITLGPLRKCWRKRIERGGKIRLAKRNYWSFDLQNQRGLIHSHIMKEPTKPPMVADNK
jgi:hypothetical protein